MRDASALTRHHYEKLLKSKNYNRLDLYDDQFS